MDVAPERLWSSFAINHRTPARRGIREAKARCCYQPVHRMLGGSAWMSYQRGHSQVLLSAHAPDARRMSMDVAPERLWSSFAINHRTPARRAIREAKARCCCQPVHRMLGGSAWMSYQRGYGQVLLSAHAPDARRMSMDVAPERLWSSFAINHRTPARRGIREAKARCCEQPVHRMLGGSAWMSYQRGYGQVLLSATAPDARSTLCLA